jgi:membrane-associated protease RseP (regulator of RpoE activity)
MLNLKPWQWVAGLALMASVLLTASGSFAQEALPSHENPQHWVGVFCRPLDETLRTQLHIPAGQGVVIDGVAAESPAAEAGLQSHDILIAVNGEPLGDASELLKFVEEAGGKKLTFKLIRQGKEQTVKVTPAARPKGPAGEAFQLPRQNLDPLRMWIDHLNDPAHGALHLRGFGPAVTLGRRARPNLPEDVSIQINKTGQKPAKIVVTRGEEKWELSDSPEQIAKLPVELRPAVESMLGLALPPFQVRVPGSLQPLRDGGSVEQAAPEMEQRLRAVEQRLEKLLQEMETKPAGK